MSLDDQTPVLFEERACANGMRIGFATLNAPRTLNGFSLAMAHLLSERLAAWQADDGIAAVVLQGAGEKAFCAGGDLHGLYQSMLAYRQSGSTQITDNRFAAEFFAVEYRLDHAIHHYPKPLLCWGHGIVMGGGLGLMGGASHRVVSERSKLAFPEISVGLFPDVGGSWLLGRVPGNAGLFLGLTGALLGPGDAIHAGLADVHILEARRTAVLEALLDYRWQGAGAADKAGLDALLQGFASAAPMGPLQQHAGLIDQLCQDDGLEAIVARLLAVDSEDAWLQAAVKTLRNGAPGSARLAYVLGQQARGAGLAEVFRMEYTAALHGCAHGDFAEGIRAVLIDKDRSPHWQHTDLAQADAAWAQGYFKAPWPADRHPLADLADNNSARN